MRDLKTYLSVAPVASTLWFVALAGSLDRNQSFIPGCIDIPLFFILIIGTGGGDED